MRKEASREQSAGEAESQVAAVLLRNKVQLRISDLRTLLSNYTVPGVFGHARCPYCGNCAVHTMLKRDRLNALSLNPFRRLLGFLGAPIRFCLWCRFQFHDPRATQKEDAQARSVF